MKILLMLLLLVGDGGAPDAGHVHCWHTSSMQHLTVNHGTDEDDYSFVPQLPDGGCP